MRMFKRIVFLCVALSVLFGASVASAAGLEAFPLATDYDGYSDIASDKWYCEAIESSTRLGLLCGRGGGIFDPDGNISICEVIKIAVEISVAYNGAPKVREHTEGEEWFTPYVERAIQLGIASEPAAPNAPATRAQLADVFSRALPESELGVLGDVTIPDVDTTDEYADGIYSLYRAGILIGRDDCGNFFPEATLTRAEASIATMRLVLPAKRQIAYMTKLENQLKTKLSSLSGTWSLYFKDIETGKVITINDEPQRSASVIKMFVAARALYGVENGTIKRDANFDANMSYMLRISSNDAWANLTTIIGGKNYSVGEKRITQWCADNGYSKTGIMYLAAVKYETQVTRASDCGRFLESLLSGTCVSKAASEEILGYLKQQTRLSKIPSGVPKGVKTANKTGELSEYYKCENDACIVYAPFGTYVLVLLSNGCSNLPARQAMGEISSLVYSSLQTAKS